MPNQPTRGRRVAGTRFLAALAYGDYQTLWTANFFAGAAAWALIVARGWIVYEISDSSYWVGRSHIRRDDTPRASIPVHRLPLRPL